MYSIATLFPRWGTIGRWHTTIGWLLALALAGLTFAGYGPGGSACRPAALTLPSASVTPPPVTTPAVAAPAPAVAPPPAAKVYFGLDKFDMPATPNAELAAVIAYLKANPGARALVSGYHDPSGNLAHNEELAKNRAVTVRGALEAAGIPNDRVVMAKPAVTTGSGEPQEARRVEVSVQP
jgi:K(+)-stimulated pyrophosphate-energized sodium pump